MPSRRRAILNRVRDLERDLDYHEARGTFTLEQVSNLRQIHEETRRVLSYVGPTASLSDRDAAILADFEADVPLREIAGKWGLSHERVRQIAVEAGAVPRGRGWNMRRPPLTEAQVAGAAQMYQAGARLDVVARHLETHADKVRAALREAGVQIRGPGGGLAPHGTRSAYNRHCREDTTPCEPCRKANREYRRQRSAAARVSR